MPLPPTNSQLGRYRLARRLGGGGMGEVFVGTLDGAGGFSREVALKVIRSDLSANPRFLELFLREGRALAAINHRGVVQVHELDVASDGRAYMAMEYLRGMDLGQLQRAAGGPLPWPLVAYVGAEVAYALHAAHRLKLDEAPNGLLHGDLTHSNVMVCFDGAVKVLDFGLARPAGFEPSTLELRGKLPYLAPESATGVALDARADVYALGVVLYELLTDRRLFRGENDLEVLHRVLHEPVTPPSALGVALPQELEDAVMRALSRDRGQRFESALPFAELLERLAAEQFRSSDLARFVRAHAPEGAERPEGEPGARSVQGTRPDAGSAEPRSGPLTQVDSWVHPGEGTGTGPHMRQRQSARVRLLVLGAVLLGGGLAYVVLTHQTPPEPAARSFEPRPAEQDALPALAAPDPVETPPTLVAPAGPTAAEGAPAKRARSGTRRPATGARKGAATQPARPQAPERSSGGLAPGVLADPFGDR